MTGPGLWKPLVDAASVVNRTPSNTLVLNPDQRNDIVFCEIYGSMPESLRSDWLIYSKKYNSHQYIETIIQSNGARLLDNTVNIYGFIDGLNRYSILDGFPMPISLRDQDEIFKRDYYDMWNVGYHPIGAVSDFELELICLSPDGEVVTILADQVEKTGLTFTSAIRCVIEFAATVLSKSIHPSSISAEMIFSSRP
jgi:hypothetical protein